MVNDVSMLEWAGSGIAVANAHAEVLAVADEITSSNDEDVVALVLERLLYGAPGNRSLNSAPPPSASATSIEPPCASTVSPTIARPRPEPGMPRAPAAL